MNEMQRILVEDRIHQLERDAAAIRAGREHPLDSTRVRLGRWLVGVGSAIGGGTAAVTRTDDPCDDRRSPQAHAA